ERQRGEGATVINMAVDGTLVGILAIADPVKQSTPEALRELAAEGVRVIMLTGDNRTTAWAVARRLGIADVEAEVLPDQKSAVVAVIPTNGYSESDVLRLAASVERASEHPLADAIVNAARERDIQTSDVQDFDSPVGKGALGTVEGKKVLLGNATFLSSEGVDTSSLESEAERQRGEGATVINMAVDGTL
ncbi:hypothetical protein KXV85_003517, partial [Aspergillus fumigatus]